MGALYMYIHAMSRRYPAYTIDADRSTLYGDLIKSYAPEAMEVNMNSLGFEYQSNFARRYYGEGKAEGLG